MGKRIEIKEGQVYYPKSLEARDGFRRVVGVVGDRVFYSNGGDRNYCCKRDSFMSWRGEQAQVAA